MTNIKFIDLGLPSGTLWGDRNLGADAPEKYGDYYRFGQTTPFTEDSEEYEFRNFGENIAGTGNDAATVILGENFRMATYEQQKELLDLCTWEWANFNGVNGMKVTGLNGNSIFFPAAGEQIKYPQFLNNLKRNEGCIGNYWISLSSENGKDGFNMWFNDKISDWSINRKTCAYSIRPVFKKINLYEGSLQKTK